MDECPGTPGSPVIASARACIARMLCRIRTLHAAQITDLQLDFLAVSRDSTLLKQAALPYCMHGRQFASSVVLGPTATCRPDWSLAEDDIGKGMQACVAATMALRNSSASIRSGWANVLHEDRQNGVVAFERVRRWPWC
jgi:hypothetical protein